MQWGHEGIREPDGIRGPDGVMGHDLEPDLGPEEEIFDIYNICQK